VQDISSNINEVFDLGLFGSKKKAFGGYSISFAGCDVTLEKLFGSKPIAPSEMTKKLWKYVKAHKLGKKR